MSRQEERRDPYLAHWKPQAYLRQYYSLPDVPDDSRVALSFLAEQLSLRGIRQARAIEFGCGPSLGMALALVPYVRELHLADYLPANLEEVRLWLNADAAAHDWSVYTRHILELEQLTAEPGGIALRERALREQVVALRPADIRQPLPLTTPETFELVASFFCIECVSPDRHDWRRYLAHLSSLVAKSGTLVLASLRHCSGYGVLGRQFPAVAIDEDDLRAELPALGYDPQTMVVRMEPVDAWTEEGFDSICLVAAEKKR